MGNEGNGHPPAPTPGVPRRFYFREQNGVQRRDHKVRRLAAKVRGALPWLEDADASAVRTWAELELLSTAAFAELRDGGFLTPDKNPRALVGTYTKLRQVQLAVERELGMTPSARMAIRANGTRAAFDLALAANQEETPGR